MKFFQEMIENCKTIFTKKYFCFAGRADRKEFWMWVLALIIINFILFILRLFIPALAFLSLLFSLAVLLPSLGVTARRLHDTGKSGWLQLLGLIPMIGGLIVLILCIPEGSKESNAYGEPVAAAPAAPAASEENK